MNYKIQCLLESKKIHTIYIIFLGLTTIFKEIDEDSIKIHQYTPLTNSCDIWLTKDKQHFEFSNRAFSIVLNHGMPYQSQSNSEFITIEVHSERQAIVLKTPSSFYSMETFVNDVKVSCSEFIEKIYYEFVKSHQLNMN